MDLYIDERGFLYVDDFKLPCKLNLDTGCLEFKDKDHNRSAIRGSEFVQVPIALISILGEAPPQTKSESLKG